MDLSHPVFLAVLVALLTTWLCAEGKALHRFVVRSLIAVAVKMMPEHRLEQCAEEWAGDCERHESPISKLVFASGCVIGAWRLHHETIVWRRMQILWGARLAYVDFICTRIFAFLWESWSPGKSGARLAYEISGCDRLAVRLGRVGEIALALRETYTDYNRPEAAANAEVIAGNMLDRLIDVSLLATMMKFTIEGRLDE